MSAADAPSQDDVQIYAARPALASALIGEECGVCSVTIHPLNGGAHSCRSNRCWRCGSGEYDSLRDSSCTWLIRNFSQIMLYGVFVTAFIHYAGSSAMQSHSKQMRWVLWIVAGLTTFQTALCFEEIFRLAGMYLPRTISQAVELRC